MAKRCVACGNKTGLVSYKINDNQIVCASCMKKAGYGSTTPYKILRSLTLDDLKKPTNERKTINNINLEKHENVGSEKMKTAEEMSNFCIKYGYGQGITKKWTFKHFSLVANNLSENEYVVFCFIGLHNYISTTKHDGNYGYALTNKRLLIAQQKVVGNSVKSIILDKLNDITKQRGILLGVLTIDTLSEIVNVAIDKDSVDRISDSLNEIIYDFKHSNDNIILQSVQQNSTSSADEIRKFKELLDEGIISEEDFSAKKKELLNL